MSEFKSRKIKFKAWDTESRLLMRLNAIECNKGELVKKNHVLLQFTGLHDREEVEVYEMDVLLVQTQKFIVFWEEERNGWFYSPLENRQVKEPFLGHVSLTMKRFCSFFELDL